MSMLVDLERWFAGTASSTLQAGYQELLSCRYVQEEGKFPTCEQFVSYWRQVLVALRYMSSLYGAEAIPFCLDLRKNETYTYPGGRTHPIFVYFDSEEDALVLSMMRIVLHAFHFGRRDRVICDYHYPGMAFRAEEHALLQAVEECYHRYQVWGLGRSFEGYRRLESDPIEQEITAIGLRAIGDFGLPFYPLDDLAFQLKPGQTRTSNGVKLRVAYNAQLLPGGRAVRSVRDETFQGERIAHTVFPEVVGGRFIGCTFEDCSFGRVEQSVFYQCQVVGGDAGIIRECQGSRINECGALRAEVYLGEVRLYGSALLPSWREAARAWETGGSTPAPAPASAPGAVGEHQLRPEMPASHIGG